MSNINFLINLFIKKVIKRKLISYTQLENKNMIIKSEVVL